MDGSGCETRHCFFFFSSRRRHTRCGRDWSSDVCSSDLHTDSAMPSATLAIERVRTRNMPGRDITACLMISVMLPLSLLSTVFLLYVGTHMISAPLHSKGASQRLYLSLGRGHS